MFQKPKCLQNNFSIIFPRKISIRRKAFDFENKLENFFNPPQVIEVPDNINPELPRMVFTSKHGHSQIIISQMNFVLNVNYSIDWQSDLSKGREYLLQKVSILFDLLEIIDEKCPSFCGLNTLVQIPAEDNGGKVISHINNFFSNNRNLSSSDIYEFQSKISKIVSSQFFSSIIIQNYRNWDISNIELGGILKFPINKITESGIQILGDFNDRYIFNEKESYCSEENQAKTIIELGLNEINTTIEEITRSL